jgi:hypothetical protein
MQSIDTAGKDWGGPACGESSHRELQTWERGYQNLPVPGEVNGATDAQRADAYRAAIRACLRLLFEGSVRREPGAKAWPERVWAIIQQYGAGRAWDLEGSSVESSGYETALYDILDWYREIAARARPSSERLERAPPAPI